jgi:hypothetical protein
MMARIGVGRATALGAGIAFLAISGVAHAQMPSEAAEISSCLCMHQEISRLSADMAAKMGALQRLNRRVADLAARLRDERSTLDVNNPAAVEHYKALLEEHDSLRRASVGPVWKAADDAVARYDAVVRQYDGSCAHRLYDSVLLNQIRATLSCPAPGYGPPPGPPEAGYTPAPGYGPPAAPESGYPPGPPESGFPSGFPPAPPPPYPGPR